VNLSEYNNCFTYILPVFRWFPLESRKQNLSRNYDGNRNVWSDNHRKWKDILKNVLCGDWWKIWKGLINSDEMSNRSSFKWFFTSCEVIVQILSDKGLSNVNFSWIFFVSEYQHTKDTGQPGIMFLRPDLLNRKIANWAENSTYLFPLWIIRSVHFWQESNGWVIQRIIKREELW